MTVHERLVSRQEATRERYADVRGMTDELAEPLSAEDQTVQSMPDVSPTKWHRAHTSWFFETFLLRAIDSYSQFDPAFGFLFNSYYETLGPRHTRAERGLLSRPGADEIGRYRRHVDDHMGVLLEDDLSPHVDDLVQLGLHHEQQHQELLLMDIKHVLSVNPLQPVYRSGAARPGGSSPPVGWVDHDGGLVEIGHDGSGFCFDNETPQHPVHLQPYALADRPVTCGDWLEFIDDGGYRRPDLWLSDGWATVQQQGWDAPLYWWRDGSGSWQVFTLHGIRTPDPAEPVCHLSYYEADAYARWAGCRLPTEAEWEHAVSTAGGCGGRFDLDELHPRAPQGGLAPSVGEVWEWTASSYLPYPGFRAAPGAVGEYNGKFMVNQQVLRGGACVTPPGHARPTYRNFFPAAARWPVTGARLARDL